MLNNFTSGSFAVEVVVLSLWMNKRFLGFINHFFTREPTFAVFPSVQCAGYLCFFLNWLLWLTPIHRFAVTLLLLRKIVYLPVGKI